MRHFKCSFSMRFLSMILCLALLAGFVSPAAKTAYAAEIEPESSVTEAEHEEPVATYVQDQNLRDETVPDAKLPAEEDEPFSFENDHKEAAIVSEDAERKDLYTKDFLLSDMTRLLVVYPDAIHFEKDGTWVDVDNTLEPAKDEKTGRPIYKNRANSVEITLPEALSAEEGPQVTVGKDSIRFVLAGITEEKSEKTEERIPIHPSTIEINESPIPEKELAEMSERQRRILPLQLFSEAVYREVLPGTDVIYDLNSTTLKESIVLNHAPEAATSYVFHIYSDTLDLKLNDDNSISALNKSGEEIFTIPAPFAYDAAEETSHDVKVTLEKINNESQTSYEIIITPDYQWLSSPERVYPVIIDPSVFTTQIRENIKDMAVASNGGEQL